MARVVVAQHPHHVTQRGNGRRQVFFTTADRQVYLGLLKQYSEYYSLRILGYCLMTNHVHLVAIPDQPTSLARALRETHGRYARYRNAIEQGSGHLWQNRYYSCVVGRDRVTSVMKYVELNPVRAGLVREAGDYAWSSALMHLGGSDALGLLDGEAWTAYASTEDWTEILQRGAEDSAAIRDATYSGRPLGDKEFGAGLESQLGCELALRKRGRPRRASLRAGA